MPRQVSPADIEHIENALLLFPNGASATQLADALRGRLSARTLRRRLAQLVRAGRIARIGAGRGTRYFHSTAKVRGTATRRATPALDRGSAVVQYAVPDGTVELSLSADSRHIRDYVSRPLAARRPCGYERRLLEEYRPNDTAYIPDKLKVHLHRIGQPIVADRPAGTFARDIRERLLVDLSWSSSRLEGNTYTRLDTAELIQFGRHAAGKDAKETQMILNHKAAIDWLFEGGDEVGINRHTFLNLHALLSENLMSDPEASGRLRRRPVDIQGSVYTSPGVPQVVDELFAEILRKAAQIGDPFEQAFFVMVHVPYLQPFEDVNKRVSRLAANIPMLRTDICPLSFIDVAEAAYIDGYLGIYELTRFELLRDIFAWAYQRSCERYVVIRDSVAEPDLFRLRYREALIEVIGQIVRRKLTANDATIRELAGERVVARDVASFVSLVSRELERLDAGNIARFRVTLPEFRSWHDARQGQRRPA
jgi:Fic family protein